MGNNNWQVQAPSINLYALDGMYKNRNIIPTGENTLVGMLQGAWNTGKKALQEDFKNNVIGNTDSAEITKAKAQGMTTNQYLQNQASNKGWLMDYIANPLSNPEVQTAADTLDKDELGKYRDYLNQQTYDEFVTDRTGATTDAVAKIQKALLARPVNERSSLLHDAIFNIGKGTAERLINPNDTLLMELNKQLVLNGKQPILSEDIMHSPDRLLQALRGMDKSEGTKLYDTVAAREGFNSLFTKGPNEAKSRADEILGTDGGFAKAVQYTREAKQVANAFKAQFPNLAELTPESYKAWKTSYFSSMGYDPNSIKTKNASAAIDGIVKNYANEQYQALVNRYQYLLRNGNPNSATVAELHRIEQEILKHQSTWGNELNPSIEKTFAILRNENTFESNYRNSVIREKELKNAQEAAGSLTVPVDSRVKNNILNDSNKLKLFSTLKDELYKAVKEDPELKNLNISKDAYDTVIYNFINQMYTPSSEGSEFVIRQGLDLARLGEGEFTKLYDLFNAKKIPNLRDTKSMNLLGALKALYLQSGQSQNLNNYR